MRAGKTYTVAGRRLTELHDYPNQFDKKLKKRDVLRDKWNGYVVDEVVTSTQSPYLHVKLSGKGSTAHPQEDALLTYYPFNILEAPLSEVTVEELFGYLGFTEDLELGTRKHQMEICQKAAQLLADVENLQSLGPVPIEIPNLTELDRLFEDLKVGFTESRGGRLIIVLGWMD
jgi:hypothetical protein